MSFAQELKKKPGGWGNNCTCGGNWQGQMLRREGCEIKPFGTWQEAIAHRHDPALTLGGEVGVTQLKFRESAEFIAALEAFLTANA